MHPGIAMVKNTCRRLTCKNASNCVNFCSSRCCFARAMDAKIVQNRRKFITKWPQKIRGPVLHWSKTRAVDWPAKMYRNAFIFVTPGVALLSPWMQNRSKSWKSAKLVQKLKNHQKNNKEIPKHHKQCSNTWLKREKHEKIEKIYKYRWPAYFSKNPVLEPTKIARNRRFPLKIVKFAD